MSRMVFRIEWYRWLRTRRLVALVAAFALFGCLSLFGAKYLPDLLGQSSEIRLLRTPDWHDGLQQYVKNSGLLLAAVSMVLAAQACAVRGDTAIGIYYLSRETSPLRLYLPRLLVAGGVVAAAALFGAALALYECHALFGPFPLAAATSWLAVQWFALITIAIFTASLAARTHSAGLAAATTAGLYVLSLFAASLPSVQPWLPTTALQPTITTTAPSLPAATKSLAALLILSALATTSALTTPIRTIRTTS
ncbi:hypothetical protein [Nocardia macrotermitis]|uniref:ABC-2 type transport system permease protein n=1 Tax=Nocardia macrotermitis TaxID=2585198 RepID=A0A7K0DEH9_9NOCA|nr:hypothetical protein [Nocardia macrotermitis]MQY24039.1 hypothetical protein [Nocardia macrotermitis]